MSPLDEFKTRLTKEWLIPFCSARGYSHQGFVASSIDKLTAADACDFMQAVDSGLVNHHEGTFTAICSRAKEQIFTQGERSTVPRKVTLWLEPIITIAGLMRLFRDYGWPADRLGMQSQKPWAFDLVAYAKDKKTELLLCEIKKTKSEVDKLIELMTKHSETPAEAAIHSKNAERNAIKKVIALRKSASTTFWVLGPNLYERVFNVIREPSGAIRLRNASRAALSFSDT